jgi:hypothetical protein
MAAAGFDVLSLANNHSLDYGARALEDTWRRTVEAGMLPVGVRFVDRTSAQAPGLVRVGSRFVAFLAYTDIFPKSFRGLYPGPFPLDARRMAHDIRRARASATHVIVSLHIGREYSLRPTARQREMARTALDAGATVVVQHHTHTPQPVEVDVAAGRVAAYGLGNFVFDLRMPWKRYRVRRGEVLRVRLDDRLREARLLPVALDDENRPRMDGDLDVQSLTNPDAARDGALWFVEAALRSARVERVTPDGPVPCHPWIQRAEGDEHALDGYFRCSSDLADAVGRSADLSAGRWRSVVRAVPRPDSSVRLSFDGVPGEGRLVGFAGLSDWAATEPDASPVLLEWTTQDGPIASLLVRNEPGWQEFSAPIPQGWSGRLTATISASQGVRRHLGFNAWIIPAR